MNDPEQNPEQSEDNVRKSHWRDLAETLGAPPAEEPAEAQSVSDTDEVGAAPVDTPVGQEAAKQARTLPPRPPSDWFALANDLGIEVEPPAPPVVEEESAEPVAQQDVPSDEHSEDLADGQRDDATDDQAEAERAPSVPSVVEEPFDLRPPAKIEEQVTFELEVAAPDTMDFIEDTVEALRQDDLDEVEAEEAEAEEAEESEQEDSQPVAESPSRRRRRRGRRRSSGPEEDSESTDSESAGSGTEELDAEAVPEEADDADSPALSDEEKAETTRKRRPRRRRRRSRSDESMETDSEAAEEAEVDERSTQARKPEGEGAASGGRTKHRKIPTWEEAISVIVASNIESRSKSNGPKGKPRGSRRRRG